MAEKSKGQPKLVLNRNYVLTTNKGHSIEFVKGKPVHVPPAVYADAIAIGAVPEDGSDANLLEDAPRDNAPADPAERAPLILEAIKALVERNRREDFTAAGAPTAPAVTEQVGFKVQAKEVATVWQAYHEQKAGE